MPKVTATAKNVVVENISGKTSYKSLKDPVYKKAYDAFHNAKQRCTKPTNPSYAKYGALGVKMLFANADQLIADVGLPPNMKATLDRIDPSGNYEPGNLRWASKAVQAVNKKGNPLASIAPIQIQIAQAKATQFAYRQREAITDLWRSYVTALNRGSFVQSDVEIAKAAGVTLLGLQSGWEIGQPRDLAAPPSFFYMPSLTHPGEFVRLTGGPFPKSENLYHEGTLPAYKQETLSDVLALPARKLFSSFLDHSVGHVLAGGDSEGWKDIGGIEGAMLVFASILRSRYKIRAAHYSVMEVLSRLNDIGPSHLWDTEKDAVLDAKHLFIPDFHVDCGAAMQPTPQGWALLAKLLDYRIKEGHLTHLGVQNFQKFPDYLRKKLLTNFDIRVCEVLTKQEFPVSCYFAKGDLSFKGNGFEALKAAWLANINNTTPT